MIINPKDTFLINIQNAKLYLDNVPYVLHASDCTNDGGVADGQVVPEDKNTLVVVSHGDEIINIPVEIRFEKIQSMRSNLIHTKSINKNANEPKKSFML